MTDTVQIPTGITVEQAFNYLFHHIEQGREKQIMALDQRGLGYVFSRGYEKTKGIR